MVQLPSAASDRGNRQPAALAASWMVCKMQPASTVMVRLTGSSARMLFRRASDSTMAVPASSGMLPNTRPVLPPCGTTGICHCAQARRMAATCSTLAGRSTASALPVNLSRQSVRKGDISASLVST